MMIADLWEKTAPKGEEEQVDNIIIECLKTSIEEIQLHKLLAYSSFN